LPSRSPTIRRACWPPFRTHLLSLINEVLDLSKIEAGKLELNPELVDLARLIDEVIGTARQLAEKNKNRLIVEAHENLGMLTADSMRLKQILLNLLSNACKFTKEGAVATVATASSQSPTTIHCRRTTLIVFYLIGAILRGSLGRQP
jgi:signal transduction histidine kinase